MVLWAKRLNDWKTIPTSARNCASSLPSSGSGVPSMRISPCWIGSSRLIARHIVDLPDPDGPITTTTSRSSTVRLMSCSTWRSPNHLFTSINSTSASTTSDPPRGARPTIDSTAATPLRDEQTTIAAAPTTAVVQTATRGSVARHYGPAAPVTRRLPRGRPTKILLDESEIPTHWYNIVADLPEPPPPPLHPGTHEPIGPEALAPLFPMALIEQEVSTERYIEIPEEVREVYRLWRPVAAVPGAPAREGARHPGADLLQVRGRVSPAGSAQAQHRRARRRTTTPQEGMKRLTTETGAGQWGTALAFACASSAWSARSGRSRRRSTQKPYRASMIETWGATIHSCPST